MQVKFDVPKDFFLKGVPCRIDLKAGQAIGHYIVESILGNGTFGIVFKVKKNGICYALKLLKLWEVVYKEQKETVGERFLREYHAAQTPGEYLVKSHLFGEIDNNPFFIMDYVKGGDLRKQIGKLTSKEIQSAGCDILKGLKELHSVGIVHRDLKPDNVLLSDNGSALLTDFGISAFVNHHIKRVTKPNLFGNVKETFGTYAYIPPEQLINAKKYSTTTPRTDIWSWGVLMYELFSGGYYPWGKLETESDLADFIKNVNTGNQVHTAGFKNMPDNWVQIIKQSLQPKFENRIADVSSILQKIGNTQYQQPNLTINSQSVIKLKILQGINKDKVYELIPNCKINNLGRAPNNQIYVEDFQTVYISREHATIECIPSLNAWFIRDGQWNSKDKCWKLSTNGTYLNSTKIDKAGTELKNGDIITVGDTTIRVENGSKIT